MLSRCFAGILLGAPLAAFFLGLCVWISPGPWENVVVPWLLLFFPAWVGVMAATYLFRSATRAWVVLLVANVAMFGLLWLVRDIAGAV